MRVGIGIGDTHTDVVATTSGMVLGTVKRETTPGSTAAVEQAIAELLRGSDRSPAEVDAVMVGTTQFSQALSRPRDLLEVGCIRIGLPAGRMLPPLVDWPEPLRRTVGDHVFQVGGGHEYDGRRLAPLDEDGLRRAAEEIAGRGLRAVAIASIFSPGNDECEVRAAEIVAEIAPEAAITQSSTTIGSVGLLPRESAAILNASLTKVAGEVVDSLTGALLALGLKCPLYISQNDGTLMTAEYARRFPTAALASGASNSMRGAAVLAGERDCAVVDVGGDRTDIGLLADGLPLPSHATAEISGVRTNIRMPALRSIPIGGGSVIADGRIGPESLGADLVRRALVFGGDVTTLTDLAVAVGRVQIGDRDLVAGLDRAAAKRTLAGFAGQIVDAIDRLSPTENGSTRTVLVGGGADLLGDSLPGISSLLRPQHGAVADAVGVANSQIGGEVDVIFSLGSEQTRLHAFERAGEMAAARAVEAGARGSSVQVTRAEEMSIGYLPGPAVRIRAKAVGDLALEGRELAVDH